MHLLYKLFNGLILRLESELHYSSKLAVGYYMLLTGSLALTYHPQQAALRCRT